MGNKACLRDIQASVLDAIAFGGNRYDDPIQIARIFFGDKKSASRERVRSVAKNGLKFIKKVFDSVGEDGSTPFDSCSNLPPKYQKDLLMKIKKSFTTFDEFEKNIFEFIDKKKA